MFTADVQLILAVLTLVGSAFGSYLGVRIAIAESKKDIASLKDDLRDTNERVRRLEEPYFRIK